MEPLCGLRRMGEAESRRVRRECRLGCQGERVVATSPSKSRCMARALAVGAAAALLTVVVSVHAQLLSGSDPNGPALSLFTATRWSMIRPARDFEGGCVVGFLAFQFSPTGYFVFNNRIRGSWRIDELGNLKLRTRDGILFTLLVDGSTLRSTVNLPFLRRTDLYQRCPE
jgi:hypothetical protein